MALVSTGVLSIPTESPADLISASLVRYLKSMSTESGVGSCQTALSITYSSCVAQMKPIQTNTPTIKILSGGHLSSSSSSRELFTIWFRMSSDREYPY